MTITSAVNEAKDDLDHILGEARRLLDLMAPMYALMDEAGRSHAAENIADSIDTINAKARKIRASL